MYVPVYTTGDRNLQTTVNGSGTSTSIACDVSHSCVFAVVANRQDLTGAVYTPLSFALDASDCPSPGSNAVFGSGSATAYRAIFQWQTATCVAPASLPTIYAASNSIDGVDSFAQGQEQANFAVTGPVPPITLPSTAPSFKLAPITSSAVVIAYRVFDRRGNQITNLTLTPYEIGQLFQGQLSLYTDPGVASLNPGVEFWPNIAKCVRAEHSAETYVFTSWLTAMLGTGTTAGFPPGARTIYPDIGAATHAAGSRGEALCVQAPGGDQIAAHTEMFGYMDSSTAAYYGLPTVRIRMPSGSIVAATSTSIAEGVSLATPNSDGSWTPDYTPTDPLAYPMSYPSYMVAPTSKIAGDQGKVLASFLKYAVQQGQTGLPPGYAPLPAVMVNQSLSVADQIPQSSSESGSGGPGSGADAASLGGDFGLNGLDNGNGDFGLGADSSTGVKPTSANGGKPGRTASGPPIPAIALAGSMGRWMLLAVAVVAAFGIVAGPLTYVVARPWPPPWLRRLRRAVRLRRTASVTTS
jgi:ABC-type phosphate transport system substrate-binding protein